MSVNINILSSLDIASIDIPIPETANVIDLPPEQGGGQLITGPSGLPLAYGLIDLMTVQRILARARGVQDPSPTPNDYLIHTIGGFDRSGAADSISFQFVTAGADRTPPSDTSRFNVGAPLLLAPAVPTRGPFTLYAGQRIEVQPGGGAPLSAVLVTLVFEPVDAADLFNPAPSP